MHDGGNPVGPQRVANGSRIRDVCFHQLAILHSRPVARDEVVVDHDAIASAVERLGRVAADVAGATGDEDPAAISAQWSST